MSPLLQPITILEIENRIESLCSRICVFLKNVGDFLTLVCVPLLQKMTLFFSIQRYSENHSVTACHNELLTIDKGEVALQSKLRSVLILD